MSAEISSNIAEGILQAAVRLFARKGYEATSTREIVEAAGVTKPMIYYYFKNKEGLYEAVLTRFLSQFALRLRAVVDEPREPRDHLVEVVWAHLEYCREHRDFAKFFYAVFFGPEESAVGGLAGQHHAPGAGPADRGVPEGRRPRPRETGADGVPGHGTAGHDQPVGDRHRQRGDKPGDATWPCRSSTSSSTDWRIKEGSKTALEG